MFAGSFGLKKKLADSVGEVIRLVMGASPLWKVLLLSLEAGQSL